LPFPSIPPPLLVIGARFPFFESAFASAWVVLSFFDYFLEVVDEDCFPIFSFLMASLLFLFEVFSRLVAFSEP